MTRNYLQRTLSYLYEGSGEDKYKVMIAATDVGHKQGVDGAHSLIVMCQWIANRTHALNNQMRIDHVTKKKKPCGINGFK